MAKQTQAAQQEASDKPKDWTKEEIQGFLNDIAQKVVESESAYLHSVVALNQLLRTSNAAELFDDDIKGQIKDLWIKLKTTGVQLVDPPMLFGLPDDFNAASSIEDAESELDLIDDEVEDEEEEAPAQDEEPEESAAKDEDAAEEDAEKH